MSSWRRRWRISSPIMRTKKAVTDVVLLRVSASDGPCMSLCKNGIKYGRAWLTMK